VPRGGVVGEVIATSGNCGLSGTATHEAMMDGDVIAPDQIAPARARADLRQAGAGTAFILVVTIGPADATSAVHRTSAQGPTFALHLC
jgi:hypothetical protein